MSSDFSFLRIYQDLAYQRANKEDIQNLYLDLQIRADGTDLSKWFVQSEPEHLDAAIGIDAVAHAIHKDGNEVLQQIYPGADIVLFKSVLDELSGLEKTNEIRKLNRGFFTSFLNDSKFLFLEKEQVGRTTREDIADAIDEYKRLFEAGIASKGEILTLSRYFPENQEYRKAAAEFNNDENEPLVVGGPASVEMVDKQGHLITADALRKAFVNFMKNLRLRNAMAMHCLAPGTKVWKQYGGYVPIETIKEGDKVVTHTGLAKKVIKVYCHDDHDGKLLKLKLVNKEEILLTPEHRILTRDRGWIEAKDLSLEDILLVAFPLSLKNGNKVASNNKQGKTLEEYYGIEKAQRMKRAISSKLEGHSYNKGKIAPNKGKTWEKFIGKERAEKLHIIFKKNGPINGKKGGKKGGIKTAEQRRGKTWEEVYGKEKALAKMEKHKQYAGEKNPNWRGGIAHSPYPHIFSDPKLKKAIRTRDNFVCQLCGKTEQEEKQQHNRVLSIHHIDYDKNNCSESNLIALCDFCNLRVNGKRDFWCNFFKEKLSAVISNGTKIIEITTIPYEGNVYNLQVEEDRSYAGKGIIFHNSDFQAGWALPAYISRNGEAFKSGVDDTGLWLITEVRDDAKVAKRLAEEIQGGKIRSYSIAGSATKVQDIQKGANSYKQVDELELAEISYCQQGVNQGAHFDILKSADGQKTTIMDEVLSSFPNSILPLPGYIISIDNAPRPSLLLSADAPNKITETIQLELRKYIPEKLPVNIQNSSFGPVIPVYKLALVPIWLENQFGELSSPSIVDKKPESEKVLDEEKYNTLEAHNMDNRTKMQLFKEWVEKHCYKHRLQQHKDLLEELGFPDIPEDEPPDKDEVVVEDFTSSELGQDSLSSKVGQAGGLYPKKNKN